MRATGSTRTATRWPWSEAWGPAAGGGRPRRLLLPAACCLALASCVTTTRREFTLAPGGQRLSPQQVRMQGDAVVRAECPRLMGANSSATGAADLRLTVDREGQVVRSVVERGTGDDRMDQLFGTLAAGLDFDPPQGMTGETMTARVEMGYSCSPRVSVLTFRLRQPAGGELTPTPDGGGGGAME